MWLMAVVVWAVQVHVWAGEIWHLVGNVGRMHHPCTAAQLCSCAHENLFIAFCCLAKVKARVLNDLFSHEISPEKYFGHVYSVICSTCQDSWSSMLWLEMSYQGDFFWDPLNTHTRTRIYSHTPLLPGHLLPTAGECRDGLGYGVIVNN